MIDRDEERDERFTCSLSADLFARSKLLSSEGDEERNGEGSGELSHWN